MELLKLFQVLSVQRPSFNPIKKTGEHNCLVHLDLGSQIDVPVVHDSYVQASEGLAGFAEISLSSEPSEEIKLPRYLKWSTDLRSVHAMVFIQ